jgi:hypothetical protein
MASEVERAEGDASVACLGAVVMVQAAASTSAGEVFR